MQPLNWQRMYEILPQMAIANVKTAGPATDAS
jgi:hypothetical protein